MKNGDVKERRVGSEEIVHVDDHDAEQVAGLWAKKKRENAWHPMNVKQFLLRTYVGAQPKKK